MKSYRMIADSDGDDAIWWEIEQSNSINIRLFLKN